MIFKLNYNLEPRNDLELRDDIELSIDLAPRDDQESKEIILNPEMIFKLHNNLEPKDDQEHRDDLEPRDDLEQQGGGKRVFYEKKMLIP